MKMASFPATISTFFFASAFLFSFSGAAIFSPVTKDESTGLYTIPIYLKVPLQPSNFHIDLGSLLPWYDCGRHYNNKSSSYKPVYKDSPECQDIWPAAYGYCYEPLNPICFNESCGFDPENPVSRKGAAGQLLIDKFALSKTGPVSELLFACTYTNPYARIYRGFARGSTGLAALGRFNHSLPAQISHAFSGPNVFALCLPSSSNSKGVVLFNSAGPYTFNPGNNDLSKSLTYTHLILGPVWSETQIYWYYKSPEYYIGLTSFRVNQRLVSLNRTLLAIDDVGHGGTKLSTYTRYSVLQSSIYKALTDAFVRESAALNLTAVKPIAPFNVCYAADEKILSTRTGPGVPTIDLVLQNGRERPVYWRIYGSNSMVRVGNAWCLGFLDGGLEPRTSIIIGGHQLEDNLLQFDEERGRLGFSSSLLLRSATCANFKPN